MAHRIHPSRILWAFDSDSGDRASEIRALESLAQARRAEDIAIEPVVMRSDAEAESRAADGVPGWPKPTVLFYHGRNPKGSVASLLEYAEATEAELIAVGTHRRRRLWSVFAPSFVHGVLQHADRPVLVTRPETEGRRLFERVLFPTDFSDGSFEALRALVRFLPPGASIVLFHKFEYVVPQTAERMRSDRFCAEFLRRDRSAHETIASRWIEYVASQGCHAEVLFDETGDYLVDGIVTAAGTVEATLIAMTHRDRSFLDGSLSSAEEIVRETSYPVWYLRQPDATARWQMPMAAPLRYAN